ncbi:anthranilate synthase component II [Hyphococcus sp. DH-69]|uniref:anthranilate synthase component II n=1 Tax=Hyphococcus formosus TaxID=3143534 RepID=UPI00398BA66C
MILVVDNYDSFVHNLARYIRETGQETITVRNDSVNVAECIAMAPTGIVLSPGPKRPSDAKLCLALLSAIAPTTPLLGVCLGQQCLVEYFGGRTERALRPLHGEASEIHHNGTGLFNEIPSPMMAGRYHSLVSVLPAQEIGLEVTAKSSEGEIMAVEHKERPWVGVQFHPESLLSPHGRKIIENFVHGYVGK